MPESPNLSSVLPIIAAARRGDIAAVAALLAAGATPQVRDAQGNGLAHLAVAARNLPLLQWLLDRGVDPKVRNKGGQNALHWAAATGEPALAQALLAAGANIDARGNSEFVIRETPTPLYLAVEARHVDMTRLLLMAGADPNLSCSSSGATALGEASRQGNADLVALLLAHGATPNGLLDANPDHPPVQLPLALAGSGEVARRLLEAGASPQARNQYGEPLLHWLAGAEADETPRLQALAVVLAAGADPLATGSGGRGSLELAGSAAALELLDQAIEQRLRRDPRLRWLAREQRQRALMACAEAGERAALPKLARCLAMPGINVHARSAEGRTPLQLLLRGCLRGDCGPTDAPQLRALIAQLQTLGADLDACDDDGNSAVLLMLDVAAQDRPEAKELLAELVDALLAAGADPNVQNEEGCRAQDLCVDAALRARLRQAGGQSGVAHRALFALIEIDDVQGVARLLDEGVAIESRAAGVGDTPWLFAARCNRPMALRLLAARGAHQDVRASCGGNAWHLAADHHATDALSELIGMQAAGLDSPDHAGRTPLMRLLDGLPQAAPGQRSALRQMAVSLSTHGANPVLADHLGRSALDRCGSKALRSAVSRGFVRSAPSSVSESAGSSHQRPSSRRDEP